MSYKIRYRETGCEYLITDRNGCRSAAFEKIDTAKKWVDMTVRMEQYVFAGEYEAAKRIWNEAKQLAWSD